jgi:flagellar motor switch protein FliN/FliY
MNQMMGSSSTSLASIFNFSVNITPPIVKLQKAQERLDLSDEIFGVPIIAVKFKFKVGDLIDSQMVQLMSLNQAQDQVSKFISTMTSAVDETIANINEQSSLSSNINTSMNVHSTSPMPVQPSQPLQSPITVQPVKFASFDESPQVHGESNRNLDLLLDIKLKLTVELGRTEVPIKKVLELTRGSVIELDKIAGEPVELFANGKLIAKGEVVVIEDNFGLRITSITSPDNRIKNL